MLAPHPCDAFVAAAKQQYSPPALKMCHRECAGKTPSRSTAKLTVPTQRQIITSHIPSMYSTAMVGGNRSRNTTTGVASGRGEARKRVRSKQAPARLTYSHSYDPSVKSRKSPASPLGKTGEGGLDVRLLGCHSR